MKQTTKAITAEAVSSMQENVSGILPFSDGSDEKQDIYSSSKKEIEQELMLLLNNTDESFLLVGTDYRILVFNKQFHSLYTKYFSRDIRKGDYILDHALQGKKEDLSQLYNKVFTGERIYSEFELQQLGQPAFVFANKYKPAYDEEGNIIGAAVTTIDITEKKRSQQQLVENEKRFRAMVENGTDGVAIVNLLGKALYISPSVANILGYTEEEALSMDMFMVIHPDDNESLVNILAEAISKPGIPVSGPVARVKHKNGNWCWIEGTATSMLHDPAVGGIVNNFRDVTQRITDEIEKKEAQENIRIAKERYDIVARATNEAIYEWDIIKNITYWGEGYETLFGHQRTEGKMQPATWIDNLHPDEKEQLMASTNEAFKNQTTSLMRELRFRCGDGSYKIVFDKLIIQYGTDGKPLKIFGAMQDITERKKNETAIRELNEQLNKRAGELADSNAELERFAYVASHDLQEPLRMVSSFLQLLQKKYAGELDESATQYITYAVDGADRMKRLIHDLLEYSRVGTSQEKLAKTSMEKVTSQVLEIFAGKIKERGARVIVHPMPEIKVNCTQVTQLMQNLVGNALKYNTAAVPEIEIGCEEKQDSWQFFIKDNGIGIDPKFYNKIFIIFQRLHNKNQFSGTGIGLAICKKIVERHGGNIWVESTPGAGSTFFFTIQK